MRTTPSNGALRPFGVFGDTRIAYWDHSGTSIYHSLQSQIVSRFGRGSQFQASYTWSRTIANDPLDDSDGGLSADVASLDLANPDLDRGLANIHRAHIFNASLVLDAAEPRGQLVELRQERVRRLAGRGDRRRRLRRALHRLHGAIPGLNGGPSGHGATRQPAPEPASPERALPRDERVKEQWLNPRAFTLNGFQLGTVGTAGPRRLRRPRLLPGGPGALQEHQAQPAGEGCSSASRSSTSSTGSNFTNQNTATDIMNPISVTLDGPIDSATTIIDATDPDSTSARSDSRRDPRQAQFGVKLIF